MRDEIPAPSQEEQERDAQRWERLERQELNSRMKQVRGVPGKMTLELTTEEKVEAIAFFRTQRAAERAKDPVHFYRLEAPDGTPKEGDVYEMHQSKCAALNEEKMFGYMRSQKAREEARLARIAARRDELELSQAMSNVARAIAAKAAHADIPLPPGVKAQQLLSIERQTPCT